MNETNSKLEGVPEVDNLYDGAIFLLRSWAACMGTRPSDWEQIAAHVLEDTQALLRDETERQESFFARTRTVPVEGEAAEICAEMARDAAMHAAKCRSDSEDGIFEIGAGAQFSAQADALREAEKRIRSIPTDKQAEGAPSVAHLCTNGNRWRPYPSLLCSMCREVYRNDIVLRGLCSILNRKSKEGEEKHSVNATPEQLGVSRDELDRMIENVRDELASLLRLKGNEDNPSAIPSGKVTSHLQVSGWQPISTAPRDARWLRVKMADGTQHTAHYAQDLSGSEQPSFRGWFIEVGAVSGKGGYFSEIDVPVQWMPDSTTQASDDRKTTTVLDQGSVPPSPESCPHCFGERSLGDCQVTQRLHAEALAGVWNEAIAIARQYHNGVDEHVAALEAARDHRGEGEGTNGK